MEEQKELTEIADRLQNLSEVKNDERAEIFPGDFFKDKYGDPSEGLEMPRNNKIARVGGAIYRAYIYLYKEASRMRDLRRGDKVIGSIEVDPEALGNSINCIQEAKDLIDEVDNEELKDDYMKELNEFESSLVELKERVQD